MRDYFSFFIFTAVTLEYREVTENICCNFAAGARGLCPDFVKLAVSQLETFRGLDKAGQNTDGGLCLGIETLALNHLMCPWPKVFVVPENINLCSTRRSHGFFADTERKFKRSRV